MAAVDVAEHGSRSAQAAPASSGPQTDEAARASWKTEGRAARDRRPLAAMPSFKGVADWSYDWMRHPAYDPWWQWAESAGKYPRVSAAVLNISGWHDEMYGPSGATANFAGLVQSRGGRARDARTQVVVGPWTHGDDLATTLVGAREMGAGRVTRLRRAGPRLAGSLGQGRGQRRGPSRRRCACTRWAPANGASPRPGRRRPSAARCISAARTSTGRPGTLSWVRPDRRRPPRPPPPTPPPPPCATRHDGDARRLPPGARPARPATGEQPRHWKRTSRHRHRAQHVVQEHLHAYPHGARPDLWVLRARWRRRPGRSGRAADSPSCGGQPTERGQAAGFGATPARSTVVNLRHDQRPRHDPGARDAPRQREQPGDLPAQLSQSVANVSAVRHSERRRFSFGRELAGPSGRARRPLGVRRAARSGVQVVRRGDWRAVPAATASGTSR